MNILKLIYFSLIISWLLQIQNVLCVTELHWVIKREYLNPDCVEKLAVTINGVFPGPTVRAQPGEKVIIHIDNMLVGEGKYIHCKKKKIKIKLKHT